MQDRIDEAAEEVKTTIEALNSGNVDVEDLKIYTTLTKPPEEYGSTAPHVEDGEKRQRNAVIALRLRQLLITL
ncbi:hypothetical protein HRED_10102 [Candidatus Haloredivivus sp. G17]|nr:hypothetical protein HRED_10102 [Candidatus Haloredivivus sp. G17]